jgi:hypothetical protein
VARQGAPGLAPFQGRGPAREPCRAACGSAIFIAKVLDKARR